MRSQPFLAEAKPEPDSEKKLKPENVMTVVVEQHLKETAVAVAKSAKSAKKEYWYNWKG